ncbi:hypothetical protein GCM10023231_34060 [Olivibacter ginsenosidimutans]|uniref:beta-N-acetylhexosaminidase n=1 Tax=Olivibacter ginsenosidimutans TaxID=1176537 RepID=A0ABP9BYA8_9SPHI
MLRRLLTLVISCFCLQYAFAQEPTYALIPKPSSMQAGTGVFTLDAQTKLVANNDSARKNLELFNDFLWSRYQLRLPIVTEAKGKYIQLNNTMEAAGPEAYHLEVSGQTVQIKGDNSGSFYALQSLLQLVEQKNGALVIPAVTIDDKPEFGYRGIMLDVARHFFSMDELKKIVDVMAYFKFNRLHWHLTDDQGWRLEIKKYPKLTQVSAWRDSTIIGQYGDFKPFIYDGEKHGGYYTQEEARAFVKYAAERKITVIPEIELPGHSTAVLAAYPELGCKDTTYQVAGYWGVFRSIYAPKEETFKFLEDVLTEVIDIFPSKYIHIGGDEVPKDDWKESEMAQKFIKKHKLKDEHELQSFFIQRIEKFLNARGKRIIGWDEILEGGLAPNATVMSWRGEEGGIQAAKLGHDVIMTPNSYLYIDYAQAKDVQTEPLVIGGFVPLDKVYSYHPRPASLSAAEQQHILGVQANLWTEYIGTNNKLEYMLFPRILALSEIAWTAKEQQNYDDFSTKRLPTRLQELGQLDISYRIPEAKVTFGTDGATGRKTAEIVPLVANSTVYYTLDNHKADQNGHLYTGPIALPWAGQGEKPINLNYVVVTPDGRMSSMFSVPYSGKQE